MFAIAGDLVRNHRINNMEETNDTFGMYQLKWEKWSKEKCRSTLDEQGHCIKYYLIEALEQYKSTDDCDNFQQIKKIEVDCKH